MDGDKRRLLITARFTSQGIAILEPFLHVTRSGYGVDGGVLAQCDFIEEAREAQILIVELQRISERTLQALPKVELIGSCRGTPKNVDIGAATERGIPVLHTPGRNAVSVAELTLALMLNLGRNILPAARALKRGEWGSGFRSPFIRFRGVELHNKTLGVVGLGAIGREVALRASALGMAVLVVDPFVESAEISRLGWVVTTLDDLLQRSDYVSLHAKANRSTRGMIGASELERMRPTAYLINTASGQLVDEEALLVALREGHIAGAGLDVFGEEPLPADSPWLGLDNVVATPHIGGATSDVAYHQSIIMAEDVRRWITGHEPKHVYNPTVLEKS